MSDTLRIETNERIDLTDFTDLVHDLQVDAHRELADQFLTNPESTWSRSWILDGFEMSNPAGSQVQVTLGRAIIPYRVHGEIKYGMISAEGDATKIIDIAAYAPGTYGIYIRFSFVDSTEQSRIFWDASATEEIAQTIDTRHAATWEMTIESGTPGPEWHLIGDVDQATVIITDQRLFFFEGNPDAGTAYESGWSSDGGTGGSANDRDSDRAEYGVKDLQTFTRAMRQCIEDIKGRGLRRWWERDIGGMNLGFDAAPVEDRLALGAATFFIDYNAGDPQINFDTNDYLEWDAAANTLDLYFGGVQGIGFLSDGMWIGDTNFGFDFNAGDPLIVFDGAGPDLLEFVRATNTWTFYIGGAFTASLAAAGLRILDTDFLLNYAANLATINFDFADTDLIAYNRVTDQLTFQVAAADQWIAGADGLRILKGLHVGNVGTAPNDDDIMADGGINCGGTTNPTAGDGILIRGLAVGYDGAPADNRISIGDANFYIELDAGSDPLIQFDTTDTWGYDRATNTWTWTIAGNEEMILDANILGPFASGDIGLGDATHIFDDAWLFEMHIRSTTPAIELYDTNAGVDQKIFRLKNDSVLDQLQLIGVNDADTAEQDWLVFQRKALGGIVDYELDYAALNGHFHPAATNTYDIGTTGATYWRNIHVRGLRARIGAGETGTANYMTYSGDAVADSSGGACTLAAQFGGAGGVNDGWIKVYAGTTVYWVPYWENNIV